MPVCQSSGLRDKIIAFKRALTVEEVSELFNVSIPMVYKKVKQGVIPSFRLGTSVRFDPQKLADWYECQ